MVNVMNSIDSKESDHKEMIGDATEVNAVEDNNRIAGMVPDRRRPDTGVPQRNLDGSAMEEWHEASRDSERT
jgi:hypothetical protein